MTRWLQAAMVGALLAGCALPRPPDAPEPGRVEVTEPEPAAVARPRPPAPVVSESEILLSYYHHVRTLSGPVLAREHEAVRQAFVRSRSDYNRVRYAMVLSLPNTGFADEARALDILDPVVRNPNGQLRGLAFLMASQLQERRRLEASTQSLQQKLDALRSLERSMIEKRR